MMKTSVKKKNAIPTSATSAKETPPDPLLQALQDKLRTLTDRPLTSRSLLEIEKTAQIGRTLLFLSSAPNAVQQSMPLATPFAYGGGITGWNPATFLNSIGAVGAQNFAQDDQSTAESAAAAGGSAPVIPLAPSPRPENFGATIMRELMSTLGAMNTKKRDAAEIVTAIALARDKGLTDVADKLEATLFGTAGTKDESKDVKPNGTKKNGAHA